MSEHYSSILYIRPPNVESLLSCLYVYKEVGKKNNVFKVFNTVLVHNKRLTNAVTKTLINHSICGSHCFSATLISTSETVPRYSLPTFRLPLYSGTCSPEVGD